MKQILFGLILLLILAGGQVWSEDTEVLIMPVDQIKIGMKGYGKTVFKGSRIEKFDIEVIGVWKNIFPKQDMILIRCHHPVTDKAGVIQGMSGSPIYVVTDADREPEGKVIGALAYSWSFTKESIAGVTPIENMLKESRKPLEKKQARFRDLRVPENQMAGNPDFSRGQLVPLKTPLFVSGLSPRRMKDLEKSLAPFNLFPIQAGGASTDIKETVSEDLEPGSAVGVTLVRGDVDWTAIGTVTYKEKDKVLAFGHPLLQFGELSAPLTTAYIYEVLPSSAMSFKLGSGVKEVGRLTQDRRSTIVGVMGEKSKMIPMKVSVENLKTRVKESFNYELLPNRLIMPSLLSSILWSSIDTVEPSRDTATVEILTKIKVKGFDPVSTRRVISTRPSGVAWESMYENFWPIWYNPYKELSVENMSFDLRVWNKNTSAAIEKVWLEKKIVEPNELIKLNVVLKPHNQEKVTRQIGFLLPPDLPDQDFSITLTGGNYLVPDRPRPRNVKELLEYLELYYDARDLVVVIPFKETTVKYGGYNLKKLPNSVISQFVNQTNDLVATSPGASSGYHQSQSPTLQELVELSRNSQRVFQRTEYIISGAQTVHLKVRRKKRR